MSMPLYMGKEIEEPSNFPIAPCHKQQNSLGPDIGDRIIYNLLSLGPSLQFSLSLTFFLGSLVIDSSVSGDTPRQELGSHNTGREPP